MSEEVKDREDGKNMEMHAGNVESSKSLAIPNPRCFRDSAIPGKHPWASAHHWLAHRKWAPKTALCFQEINSITMSSLFYLSHHFRSSHGDCLAVRGKTLDSLRMKARGRLAYTLLNLGSWVWHRKQSSEKERVSKHIPSASAIRRTCFHF